MAASLERTPDGKWRVWRDFGALAAAAAGAARLAEVPEAGFEPPKPIIASVPRLRDPEQDDDEGTPGEQPREHG